MDSITAANYKPHAVCLPLPVQSHIKAMLKLAKLLHYKGFHITFVNTEFNHNRFLKSLGPNSLDGLSDFHFKTIQDNLPPSDPNATQDIPSLCCESSRNYLFASFYELLNKLNTTSESSSTSNNIINPPVTCIVVDGFMTFTTPEAKELSNRFTIIKSFSIAACSLMGFIQYRTLVEKGFAPLKDESSLTNGFLDKVVDWIPGMKDIRLKELPTFCWTTNPEDPVFEFGFEAGDRAHEASAVVVHTFDALEKDVLESLSSMIPNLYAIGPQQLLLKKLPQDYPLKHVGYSLWKEDTKCLQWLNSNASNSVVYVNFGSITVISPKHLVEFGWGLANSKVPFLWVIRPDMVVGESAILPPEFEVETKERGIIASWCSQEEVLNHPSICGFLTHSGWNSTVESISAGVPMLCWPFFAEQSTNCTYTCKKWKIGIEIDNDVKRDVVENLIRELIVGEKGKNMKNKIMKFKKLAEDATSQHGSSSINLDNLVTQVLLARKF